MNDAAQSVGDPAAVRVEWGVPIAMRDHTILRGTLYSPKGSPGRKLPALLTITPYTADSFHEAGVFFATNGFLVLIADCRGRGASDGKFTPHLNDGSDGYDLVESLARHPLCNGRVGMAGGSYSGYNQWATAMHAPPHLTTIMPRCASYPGLDFPIRNNIGEQYTLQWLAFTAGRALQGNWFRDQVYWSALWRDRFEAGRSYASLALDQPALSAIFAEWLDHPEPDAYWDSLTPGPDHYVALACPVLTVTGYYDDDQHGALAYYRASMQHGSQALRDNHYLIIGPWDHVGVGAPRQTLDGASFGAASVIDMRALSVEWYRWTMADGARPSLLQDKVAYFVAGADQWRHAPSLAAVTERRAPLYLASDDGQPRFSSPGQLVATPSAGSSEHSYIYDPSDTSNAGLESEIQPYNVTDIRMLQACDGGQLVYDSEAFADDVELSGFFRLDAWIAIDKPDTDFRVLIYLVGVGGESILLTNDTKRARYSAGLREAVLIDSSEPRLYVFDTFWFTSRLIRAGERLRLVIGPYNSIYTQKNYNSGRAVALETLDDAQAVNVAVTIGGDQGAVLHLPVAGRANG